MYRIFLPIASASANNKVPHSVKYIYKKVLLLSSFFSSFVAPRCCLGCWNILFLFASSSSQSQSLLEPSLQERHFFISFELPVLVVPIPSSSRSLPLWKPIVAHRSLCCCAWMQNLRRLLFASHTPFFFCCEAIWRWVFLSFVGWNLSGGNFISNVEKSSSNQVAH